MRLCNLFIKFLLLFLTKISKIACTNGNNLPPSFNNLSIEYIYNFSFFKSPSLQHFSKNSFQNTRAESIPDFLIIPLMRSTAEI
ncbi:unnamed protein product [Meloidogyne enterolobii]|uniref:Uncharacterized protein n=1 Tax=Meloidogyne enterolobii TaxID=390850 RepID=A0ACB0Z9V6_MELEN